MRRLLCVLTLSALPLLGGCARYFDMAESTIAKTFPAPQGVEGPANRWQAVEGYDRDGLRAQQALMRCLDQQASPSYDPWPTEERLSSCMRDKGFVRAEIPYRSF